MGSQGRSTFPALESFEGHRKTVPQLKSTCHTGEPHALTSGLSTGTLLMGWHTLLGTLSTHTPETLPQGHSLETSVETQGQSYPGGRRTTPQV